MKLDVLQHATLQQGETVNAECPACGKRKFYVTRKPQGLAYICFRASCGLSGFHSTCAMEPADYQVKKAKSRSYHGEIQHGDFRDLAYFAERFHIDFELPEFYRYVKVAADQRYGFPIWGPAYEYRGIVLRRPIWDGIPAPREDRLGGDYPKAVSFFEDNVKARMAWYHADESEDTVVIVEDQVSAMRIRANGITAVAILGTGFYPEFARDFNLYKSGECRYILALDSDAFAKSLGIARRWGPTFKHPLRVAALARDAKDYDTDTELMEDLGL